MRSIFKKFLIVFFLVLSSKFNAQIVVDVDGYTVGQLVEDVLMAGDDCSVFSNIRSNRKSGIGYFNRNGTDFTFSEGILLTTGYADTAPGPTRHYDSSIFVGGSTTRDAGEIGTGSDIDLDNAVPADAAVEFRRFGEQETRHDATYIEFDYVPFKDSVSFDFIFASSAYAQGNLPCYHPDVFAFLITDSSGNTKNLAVLPRTETPIRVSSIHTFIPDSPELEWLGCGAINEWYFDKYYEVGDLAIKYFGQTKILTAETDVIPGNKYHIKLVIADAYNNAIDSAVFLLKGSFNVESILGEDLAKYNDNAICSDTYTLNANIILGDEYEWLKLNEDTEEFEVILDETDSELEVTENGVYKLIYDGKGICDFEDEIQVEFIDTPVAFPIADIEQCSILDNGKSIFNLSNTTEQILGTQDVTKLDISFHLTQSDADENIKAISAMRFEADNKTIVARIAYGNCYDTTTFNLTTVPSNTSPLFEINGFENNISVCVDEFGNLEIPQVLGNPLDEDYDITWHSDYDTDVNSFEGEEYTITSLTHETKYTLTLSYNGDINNCALYTFETIITPIKAPESIEIIVTEPIFSNTHTLTVNVEGDTIENYQFQLNDGTFQVSNIFYNVPPGEHTVTVSPIGICSNPISKQILLISYPKFFTPNGDGTNDFWNISELNQAPYNILIFNRYGKLIKTINTQGNGWDGTFSGELLPQDDYWFSIEYIDPTQSSQETKQFTGHFTLKR